VFVGYFLTYSVETRPRDGGRVVVRSSMRQMRYALQMMVTGNTHLLARSIRWLMMVIDTTLVRSII
jgi:hypothetical protein